MRRETRKLGWTGLGLAALLGGGRSAPARGERSEPPLGFSKAGPRPRRRDSDAGLRVSGSVLESSLAVACDASGVSLQDFVPGRNNIELQGVSPGGQLLYESSVRCSCLLATTPSTCACRVGP